MRVWEGTGLDHALGDVTRFIPDPYVPLNIETARQDGAGRKRIRRAEIFAAVRRHMGQGEESITLRSLAAEFSVSHQTIANLGGSGGQLIEAAIVDYVAALTARAQHFPAPNSVLAWTDVCYISCARYPEYIIASTKTYYNRNSDAIRLLQKEGSRLMCVALRQMKTAGKLRREFDSEATGSCIATLIPALTYAWINGAFNFSELRARLGVGVSSLLIAGASGEHAREIAAWLDRDDHRAAA